MIDKQLYVPMNELVHLLGKGNTWTFTHLNLNYQEIARRKIIPWCLANVEGKWTMLGGNKFAFEEGMDATSFKLQFGL
jgi:hypothetical protein